MDLATGVTVAVAILSGGFGVEVFRSWRDRNKANVDLFYPVWKEEMARVHAEVGELQRMVRELSDMVRELGGDPTHVIFKETN